ncbi:MAG: hypothetical protein HOP11_02470 [Saprospiraceae bacterium]|nr:hypothetical protein [Saprospiraceae bacterium]
MFSCHAAYNRVNDLILSEIGNITITESKETTIVGTFNFNGEDFNDNIKMVTEGNFFVKYK